MPGEHTEAGPPIASGCGSLHSAPQGRVRRTGASVARTSELPEMVGEFIDLSKRYVKEQTLEPAKRLGRLAGFSFAGGFVLVLAAIFLAIAGMRGILWLLPDGPMWEGLGYILSSLALLMVTGLVMWRASR